MSRKVLITGASRGIGEAIAKRFATAGDTLHLVCRNNIDKMKKDAEQLRDTFGCQVFCYQVDCGNPQELRKVVQEIGNIDVLVNNVGISYVGLLTDMTLEQWNQVIFTNLTSAFVTCREIVPYMVRKQQGHIIQISSIWGNVGASMEVAYSASKGGINAFTKALAKELAPSHIAVNAIACGVIDTEMNACFSEEERDVLVEEIPADRMGTPEEIAEFAFSLAETTEYLTGQIITIDGGFI